VKLGLTPLRIIRTGDGADSRVLDIDHMKPLEIIAKINCGSLVLAILLLTAAVLIWQFSHGNTGE